MTSLSARKRQAQNDFLELVLKLYHDDPNHSEEMIKELALSLSWRLTIEELQQYQGILKLNREVGIG